MALVSAFTSDKAQQTLYISLELQFNPDPR